MSQFGMMVIAALLVLAAICLAFGCRKAKQPYEWMRPGDELCNTDEE